MGIALRFGLLLVTAGIVSTSLLPAQNVTEREIFDGVKLADGLDMGVNTSAGRTDWVNPDVSAMKMAYPSGQAWGAVFITVGKPKDPPRPSWDLSGYASLLVEVRGDAGTTLEIGIKDASQPDDGNEQKVIVPVFNSYRTYAIPLSKFNRADSKHIYVVTEFVFSGSQSQTVWFRKIKYTTSSAPNVDTALNGASFKTGAGSGMWVSLIGQNLSGVARGWTDKDFPGNKLPIALDGISVNVNERNLAVAYIGSTQVNALVFHDVPSGQSYFSVTNALGTSVPVRVVLQSTFPAFFALPPEGGKYAAAVLLDGAIVGKPGLLGSGVVSRPAKPGEIVQIFGTGFGPTTPLSVADEILPAPLPLANPSAISIRFGTTSAIVDWAGLVGPGLYQFNVRVPGVADGDQLLSVDVGGSRLQQDVYLTVQR